MGRVFFVCLTACGLFAQTSVKWDSVLNHATWLARQGKYAEAERRTLPPSKRRAAFPPKTCV